MGNCLSFFCTGARMPRLTLTCTQEVSELLRSLSLAAQSGTDGSDVSDGKKAWRAGRSPLWHEASRHQVPDHHAAFFEIVSPFSSLVSIALMTPATVAPGPLIWAATLRAGPRMRATVWPWASSLVGHLLSSLTP